MPEYSASSDISDSSESEDEELERVIIREYLDFQKNDRRKSQQRQPRQPIQSPHQRNGQDRGNRGNRGRLIQLPPFYAEPDAEPHSKSDDGMMSQQTQLIELPNGIEPRRWISETEWIDYIKKDPLRLRLSSVVCIFRVPNLLKDAKREAYVPRRVSLGPHHHRSAELPEMGYHKGRALRRMVKRFNSNMDFMDFANRAREEIMKTVEEIEDSYEEKIECNRETLVRMLILDGCFILEVLRALGNKAEPVECYEPIFRKKKLVFATREILYDILMLENQVPLIVLRKLLELNSAVDIEKRLVKSIFLLFNPFKAESRMKNFDIKLSNFHHLLDILHTLVVSPPFNKDERVDQGESNISIKRCRMCTGMLQLRNKSRDDINQGEHVDQGECDISMGCCSRQCIIMVQDKNKAWDDIRSIPHAVELKNAGIKFKRCKGGIKEIKFDPDSATIFLPHIFIQDNTEIVFRNLIALEMCTPSETSYVAGYVQLMNDLIDSQEDVALLRRVGILTDWLGSDKEIANLFNGLCKDVTLNIEDLFGKLIKKVNAHYNNKMKVQIAVLVRDHFSSPWKALTLLAAIVILSLTVVQTIFSIIKR